MQEVYNRVNELAFDAVATLTDTKKKIIDLFCSMRQPGGIGSKVEWHEPSDYAESMFGFRRYFTIENRVAKTLFQIAEKPPKHWLDAKIKVVRRERVQTAYGACQSALFACAFAVQSACMRAASNHYIQSPGADMTKELEVRIWSLQPQGIHNFVVLPCNIHDEIACPALEEKTENIKNIVDVFVN